MRRVILTIFFLFSFLSLLEAVGRKAVHLVPSSGKAMIENDRIKVVVSDSSGQFTIGTPAHDGHKKLLFGFPAQYSTSHTHIFVDGSVYATLKDSIPGRPAPLHMLAPATVVDTSIYCYFEVSGVFITQVTTPVYFGGNPMILIEYHIENRDDVSHSVGVLLFLDTMIDSSDNAPIATEYGYSRIGQEYVYPEVPGYWQAFERSPFQPDSLLIGEGILAGGEAVCPDRFVYGDFGRYSRVFWDYTVYEEEYFDSCVLLRWDAVLLPPGETRYIATYYGLGSAETVPGELRLSAFSHSDLLTIRDCDQYSPNPFTIDLIVSSTIIDTLDSVFAEITLPDGFSLEEGEARVPLSPLPLLTDSEATASFSVRCNVNPPVDTTYCFGLGVYAPGYDTTGASICINVPHRTETPPELTVLGRSPADGEFTSCDSFYLSFSLSDLEGVDWYSMSCEINGLSVPGEYPFSEHSIPQFAVGGRFSDFGTDTVEFTLLHIEDGDGCSLDSVNWSFLRDASPPVILEVSPSDYAFDVSPLVFFRITDSLSGVDFSELDIILADSLHLRVADTGVRLSGDTVFVDCLEAGISFLSDDSVRVCITGIQDMAVGCGPNVAGDYCWEFLVAASHPTASVLFPDTGVWVSCDSVVIEVEDPYGIDGGTISLSVSGEIFDTSSTELSFNGEQIVFTPEISRDTVLYFSLNLLNVLGRALPTLTFSVWFDHTPPYVSSFYPEGRLFSLPDSISFSIGDSSSGLDSSTVSVQVSSNFGFSRLLSIYSIGVSFTAGRFVIDPEEIGVVVAGGETVSVCVTAADLAVRCGANVLPDTCFFFFADTTGPSVSLILPEDSVISSCDTLVAVAVFSDEEGIDTGSVRAQLSGGITGVLAYGSGLEISGDTVYITVPIPPEAEGRWVDVRFTSFPDIFGNPASDTTVFSFFVDRIPPDIVTVSPAPGCTISTGEPDMYFEFMEIGSGIDTESVIFVVNDDTVDFEDGIIDFSGGRASVSSSDAGWHFVGGDTVSVCVELSDLATLCGENTSDTCWQFFIQSEGPSVYLVEPADSAVTGCDPQQILFYITDPEGVDASSIQLEVASVIYDTSSPYLIFSDDTLRFIPPAGFFHEGEVVVRLLSCEDVLHNPFSEEPFLFRFFVDMTPPEIAFVYPAPSDTIANQLEPLRLVIMDNFAGLNLEMFELSLNDDRYDTSYLAVTGDTLIFYPESLGFLYPESVEVCVDVYDAASLCPNELDTCWNFFVLRNIPQIVWTSPEDGFHISCDTVGIVFCVSSLYPIVEDSARVVVNGHSLSPTWDGNEAAVIVPESLLLDTNDVTISGVMDIWWQTAPALTFEFILDREPPVLTFCYPSDGETLHTASPSFAFGIFDVTPLDTTSFITINGDSISIFGIFTDSLIEVPEGRFVFSGGDTVNVCLHLADLPDMCEPNRLDTCLVFYISDELPEYEIIEPVVGSVTHLERQPLIFRVSSPNELDSVCVFFDGSMYCEGTSFEFSADTVFFTPPYPVPDQSEERVGIYIVDVLGNRLEFYDWYFYVDLSPPSILDVVPAPGEVVYDSAPDISFVLLDTLSGVNFSSLVFWVSGQNFSIGDAGVSLTGDRVVISCRDAGLSFSVWDTVWVEVTSVEDYSPFGYGAPNSLPEPFSWWFFIDREGCLASPNPFTPNNDGYNDLVRFSFSGSSVADCRILIYDLKYSLVRIIEDKDGLLWQWDGKDASGRDVLPGIYIYVVEEGNKVICQGTISLAR